MNALHFCQKCKKPILPSNEIKQDNKFYHQKCINGGGNQTDNKNNEQNFIKERRLTLNLKNKYSMDYFGKTLMTEVVRPYLQFKYEIKQNKYLDLIPQITMYFQDLSEEEAKNFIKNGGFNKLKTEIKQVLGDDFTIYINGILFGSLLAKVYVFFNKVKSIGKKAVNKLEKIFSSKKEEVKAVKDAVDTIRTHSFECIKGLKPNNVKFVNQKTVEKPENNEKEIKQFLEEKIKVNYDAKSNWSLETKVSDMNLEEGELSDEIFDNFINEIKTYAENEEIDLEKEIGNEINNFNVNANFNIELKKALDNIFKDSIFEYRITGLVSINKDKQRDAYYEEKSKCPNCEVKILLHATEIKWSSKILTTEFKVGRDNWFGLGVYFSDQLDYIQHYYSKNIGFIPRIDDSFSVVVSEVYYDKTKFKQIYNNNDYYVVIDHFPTEDEIKKTYKNKTIQKNGIHYIEVEPVTTHPIAQNGKVNGITELSKKSYIGREYCVTCKEQIYPIYGINFQRVDYCIIWRDSNFNSFSWSEPLKKNREIIEKMTGYNLYTESDTNSALKLVWKKKYNKIILITNVGHDLEGKKYIDKVRKILKCNAMVMFFTNNFEHLNWIKDYPNSLFCMDDYTIKNYVFNFNENGLNEIRNNIKDFFGVELKEFENPFHYPLYEQFSDSDSSFNELDCSEYTDFDLNN